MDPNLITLIGFVSVILTAVVAYLRLGRESSKIEGEAAVKEADALDTNVAAIERVVGILNDDLERVRGERDRCREEREQDGERHGRELESLQKMYRELEIKYGEESAVCQLFLSGARILHAQLVVNQIIPNFNPDDPRGASAAAER